MEPKEETNDKENLQINQQPKKTWEDPAMTKLDDVNGGNISYTFESENGVLSDALFG
jgi:hypothetical protein